MRDDIFFIALIPTVSEDDPKVKTLEVLSSYTLTSYCDYGVRPPRKLLLNMVRSASELSILMRLVLKRNYYLQILKRIVPDAATKVHCGKVEE